MEVKKINLDEESSIVLSVDELTKIEGGWLWLIQGIAGYIAGEVIDGILRYADGERAR